MNQLGLLVVLTAAIAIGWYLGQRDKKKRIQRDALPPIPRDYWLGLNYLLDEQHDQAIEMFAKALKENDQAVETHLALGGLFRRRGEVDKAIAIHERILKNLNIDEETQWRVKLELARDYFKAGLLDRAEETLQKIVTTKQTIRYTAFEDLLAIYQQQKDWHQAICVAEELMCYDHSQKYQKLIAHFYCELAVTAFSKKDYLVTRTQLREAYRFDPQSVRISLLMGQLEYQLGNYAQAIDVYKKIENQDVVFLSESAPLVTQCFDQLGMEDESLRYLRHCVQRNTALPILQLLVERLRKCSGDEEAAAFVATQLKSTPSLAVMRQLLSLHVNQAEGETHRDLSVLHELTKQLSENYTKYSCRHCGFSGKKMHWVCPTCKQWGTVKPLQYFEDKK